MRETRLSSTRVSIAFGLLGLALQAFLCASPSFSSDAVTLEIYEHYGSYKLDTPPPEMQPIVLAIPAGFLYGSSAAAPTRAWGVNLLTYYPSFTSPRDPENAAFGLACAGICNGRVLVSIESRPHSITPNSPNMADFIAHAQLKWWKPPLNPPNARTLEVAPVEPFNEGFERTLFNPKDHAVGQVDRIYTRKSKRDGHYDLTATCAVKSSRTTCTLHFSLACSPAIYVSIHGIDGSYLSRSADIREMTEQFVSAMVRRPACAT